METDLNEVLVFVHVVKSGSFTAAARALDLPKSTVSRKVSALEDRLSVRLLERTTRKLALTEAGTTYFERCASIVEQLDDARRAVAQLHEAPQGTLKLTAPVEFGEAYLGAVLVEFCRRYPAVTIDLELTGRMVDLVEEGFDLAIRPGPLPDSSMMARRLGGLCRRVYASPTYLASLPPPRTPEDLAEFRGVLFSPLEHDGQWVLERDGTQAKVELDGRVLANHFAVVMEGVVAGLGVGLLPPFTVRGALDDGTLVPILDGWATPAISLFAVYPSGRHLPEKTRAFLDFLVDALSEEPWS